MKEDEQEINKMKSEGIIEESTSPWSSKNVLVKIRVDFRQLNNITIKDFHPLPIN